MVRFASVVLAALLLAGQAGADDDRLKAGQVACGTLENATGKGVIELAQSSLSCFAGGQIEQGFELFLAVALLEIYDEERMERHYDDVFIDDWVADRIEDVVNDEMGLEDVVKARSRQLIEDRKWMSQICERVALLGPPRYWPDYLEGVGEAPGIVRIHPLLWIETLNAEMECGD